MVLTTDYDSINTKKCKLHLLYRRILIFTACFIFFIYISGFMLFSADATDVFMADRGSNFCFLTAIWQNRIYLVLCPFLWTNSYWIPFIHGCWYSLKYAWQKTWELKRDKLYNFTGLMKIGGSQVDRITCLRPVNMFWLDHYETSCLCLFCLPKRLKTHHGFYIR